VSRKVKKSASEIAYTPDKEIKEETKNKPVKMPLTGIFDRNPKGFGFIRPDMPGDSVHVSFFNTNYAAHRDRVKYEIISPPGMYDSPDGVITKVLEQGDKLIVGIFHKKKRNSYVEPLDTKFGYFIRVLAKNNNVKRPRGDKRPKKAVDLDRVVVAVERPIEAFEMDGKIVEILGGATDPGIDVLSVILQFHPPIEFPEDVLREAEHVREYVDEGESAHRKRITDTVITIDGADAKDLDDAVSLTINERGNFILGVHIADVNHYVREKSNLDLEALERGTSIYLADRVIHMLPEKLSNGICSLNEGVDRLTLSCEMEIDHSGEVIDHKIEETVICVNKRMSYPEASKILDNDETDSPYFDLLKRMEYLCKILSDKRYDRGSLEFDVPEAKVRLNGAGWPTEIYLEERGIASKIIEEFMLVCNETVAEHFAKLQIPFVFRVHDKPDNRKMQRLRELAKSFGYKRNPEVISKGGNQNEIQALIENIKDAPMESIVCRAALRTMKQARYSEKNTGHYGLAAEYYCHFTSPIRRYPDLQIHRIIKETLRGLTDSRKEELMNTMPRVSGMCSVAERRAEDLERQVLQLKKVEFMADKLNHVYDGIITEIKPFGIFVELPNTVEGMISVYEMPEYIRYEYSSYADYYDEDDEPKFINPYNIGQKIRVRVTNVDLEQRRLTFKIEKRKKK
jgi:ribonuclease R